MPPLNKNFNFLFLIASLFFAANITFAKTYDNPVLDKNSILLEFSLGSEHSSLTLFSEDELFIFNLPPRQQIESDIAEILQSVSSRIPKANETIEDYQAGIIEADKNLLTKSHILSDELFGQIADKINQKRLIIIPDGKLDNFPLAILPLPNSEDDAPFLLFNEIVYASSKQELLQISENKNHNSTASKDLLIFADPVFTKRDSRFLSPQMDKNAFELELASAEKFRFANLSEDLERLQASADESASLTHIVGVSNTDVFSGFAATKENVLTQDLSDYRIIHFATHGFFDENQPETSGMFFSAYNEKGQKTEKLLSVTDISSLNLNADLVVLSACETGKGRRKSLSNEFLRAGAKSVLSSLWKVEDNATKELMQYFYQGLAEKLSVSEALRQAQIKMMKNPQYQSPFYWAAFTVQGDFQTVPQISGKFDDRIFPILIFSFAFSGICVYRRRVNHSTAKL